MIHGLTGDHSQMGKYDSLAQMLSQRGITSLRFDCRGRGKSKNAGEFTIRHMIDDIRLAYQYLIEDLKGKTGTDSSKAFFVARGEGVFSAFIALYSYPIIAKICWAAIPYPLTSREIQGHYHEYRQHGFATLEISVDESYRLESDFFEDLREFDDAYHFVNRDDKILFIHPEKDEIHPLKYIEEFIEKIQEKIKLEQPPLLRLIKDAGHPHQEKAYLDYYLTHTINFVDTYII